MKRPIAMFSLSAIAGLASTTGAVASCPIPKCPDTARYCVFPNTANSHCEANILEELQNLQGILDIVVDGKELLIGSPDKLQAIPPNNK